MSASSLRQRGSVAAVVATALLVTACGGGSSSGAAATSTTSGAPTTSAAAGAATTSAAAAGNSSTPAAATSAAAATSKAPTSLPAPTTTKVVAKGGGSFCKDVAKSLNDASTAGAAGNPAAAKEVVQKGVAELAIMAAEAPSAIKSDIATLVAAVSVLYTAVEKANYDFTKVDPSSLTALQSPAVKAAETKVNAYVKDKCGIDLNGG